MDEALYRRALQRIENLTLIFSITGIIVTWAAFSLRHSLNFAAGSIMAFISFLMMKRLVQSLGSSDPDRQPRSARASAIAMGLRYVVIGGVVFGMIKFSGISPWPVFAGLMTTVAAVIAEIVYELFTSVSSPSST